MRSLLAQPLSFQRFFRLYFLAFYTKTGKKMNSGPL
jgi:hypothetical protein